MEQSEALHQAMREAALSARGEKVDPRCNATLYSALKEAANFVQCNNYDAARAAALGAFGIVEKNR
jgi:hypothetical protein